MIDGANNVEVKLNNGKKVPAKVVGTDPLLDLAVLEIDGTDVKRVATLETQKNSYRGNGNSHWESIGARRYCNKGDY